MVLQKRRVRSKISSGYGRRWNVSTRRNAGIRWSGRRRLWRMCCWQTRFTDDLLAGNVGAVGIVRLSLLQRVARQFNFRLHFHHRRRVNGERVIRNRRKPILARGQQVSSEVSRLAQRRSAEWTNAWTVGGTFAFSARCNHGRQRRRLTRHRESLRERGRKLRYVQRRVLLHRHQSVQVGFAFRHQFVLHWDLSSFYRYRHLRLRC